MPSNQDENNTINTLNTLNINNMNYESNESLQENTQSMYHDDSQQSSGHF